MNRGELFMVGFCFDLFVRVNDFRFKRVLPMVDGRIVPVCFIPDRRAVTCCCNNCSEANVCCSTCSFKKYFNMV